MSQEKVRLEDHIMFGMVSGHPLLLSDAVRNYEVTPYQEFNIEHMNVDDIHRVQILTGASIGSKSMEDTLKRIHQQDQIRLFLLKAGAIVFMTLVENSDEELQERGAMVEAMSEHSIEDHDMIPDLQFSFFMTTIAGIVISKHSPATESISLLHNLPFEDYKRIYEIIPAFTAAMERADLSGLIKIYEGIILHEAAKDCKGLRHGLGIMRASDVREMPMPDDNHSQIPDDAPPFIKFLAAMLDDHFKGTPVVKRPEDVN